MQCRKRGYIENSIGQAVSEQEYRMEGSLNVAALKCPYSSAHVHERKFVAKTATVSQQVILRADATDNGYLIDVKIAEIYPRCLARLNVSQLKQSTGGNDRAMGATDTPFPTLVSGSNSHHRRVVYLQKQAMVLQCLHRHKYVVDCRHRHCASAGFRLHRPRSFALSHPIRI